MSAMNPSGLLNTESAADFQKLVQENFELINESPAYKRVPSRRNGVPNTSLGPPISGRWPKDCYWIDVLRSLWVCSETGSPGTWVQLDAAVVLALPTGTIPTGYQVINQADNYRRYFWTGAAWQELYLSITGGTMLGPLIASRNPVEDMEVATRDFVLNAAQDKHYTYTQSSPSDTWPASGYINHGLAKKPSVTVVDNADVVIVGDVQYIDANNVILTFSEPVQGKAYFN